MVVFAGGFLGGFVSGLAGFGTGLTALPIWLLSIPPIIAGPLVVICAIATHAQTLPFIWRSIQWRRLAPFLVSALFGIPLGTFLLQYFSVDIFRLAIGFLLIVYSSVMLIKRRTPWTIKGSRIGNALIGFSGGVLGGLAGLSGVLPTLWINLHNWDKPTKRSFFQGFNLVIMMITAVLMWLAQYLTFEVFQLAIVALPGTMIGAWLGRRTYANLSDVRFDLAILLIFLLSGLLIIAFWTKSLF